MSVNSELDYQSAMAHMPWSPHPPAAFRPIDRTSLPLGQHYRPPSIHGQHSTHGPPSNHGNDDASSLPISGSSERPGGIGLFDAPPAMARGRGRGRGRAQQPSDSSSSVDLVHAPRSQGRGRGRGDRECPGGFGTHPPDGPHCPYDMSRRKPGSGVPPYHNLQLNQLTPEEFTYQEYADIVSRESSLIERIGFKIDLSRLLEMGASDLEAIVLSVYSFLTVECRTMNPATMLHQLYDVWMQSFLMLSSESDMPQQLPFPKTPPEVIARCLACIDSYQIIYTKLYEHYEMTRSHNNPEKLLFLRKCNEIVARMHLMCRAFACLAQVTTMGFEPSTSVERVAHEYGMYLPFLNGIELPIDFNVPGRARMGYYDPIREHQHYLFRYILTQIENQRLRIHGTMLFVQHVIPTPGGFLQTRFWKPYMELAKFIYQGIQPQYNEHVFRAIVSVRDQGVQQIVQQIASSQFVKHVETDYRYRSFRNGLYQIEIDQSKEPELGWSDPARLNGRFLPFTSPACPTDIAAETFFDTEFDPEWLQIQLQELDTLYLDTLLGTQNIRLGLFMQRPGDVASRASIAASLGSSNGTSIGLDASSTENEGEMRKRHIQGLLGDAVTMDKGIIDWKYDMSFVYAMIIFLCGRCLRPLQSKIVDHTGERYQVNDNYQCAPFFVGNPGTGKTTLLSIISKMYHNTSVHELKCNSDSQFGLGALVDENIKFVYMSETSKQLPWGVSVLNTMIEGQQTELRVMRKDPVVRTTTFTMAFAANPDQVPTDWIKDPRQGIRRRLAVFEFMIQPEKSDSELIVKLMREEELAKMFVKFNRMYLLGRAYFDAIRLQQGTFNYMQYITDHMYFSHVRAELFALASPADSFLSGDNDAMVQLDSTFGGAFLFTDVMKAVRDYCGQRQVPSHKIPQNAAMILSLQQSGCFIGTGTLTEEEQAKVTKEAMPKHRPGEAVRLNFVFGLMLKGPFTVFHPQDIEVNKSAQSSIKFEKGSSKRRTISPSIMRPSQLSGGASGGQVRMTTEQDARAVDDALASLNTEDWAELERHE